MTDYEKKYNEALKRAKELLLGNEHSNTIRSYFEHIFPELRESESENERMIRKIESFLSAYDAYYFKNDEWREIEVWLEKQKEPKQTDLPAGFYFIDLDGNKYYSKEFRYGDMKVKVATATLDAEKQKELMPPVNVDPCDASCDAYYQRGLNKGYELGLEAGKKEQKPNSTEDMPYVADEHFFEREPADSFKYKLAEYMTKNCKKGEGPYGYSYNISSESILEMAKEELIKRGELKEQNPAWSEEQIMKEAVKWLVDDDYDELTDKGKFILGSVGIGYNGYYIPYSDLLKLPKEDEQ